MGETSLSSIAPTCPGLRMAVIITMPDSLMYEAWARRDIFSKPEDVAAHLGELVRTNHQILDVVDTPQGDVWLSTETPSAIVLVREFCALFALGCIFDQSITLGAARLSVKRLIKHIEPELPQPVEPLDIGV